MPSYPTRDELEELARKVANNARYRERVTFQVRHPHYTPPPDAGLGNQEVLTEAYATARLAYAGNAAYDRKAVWLSLGIDMRTLLATLEAE